MPAYSKPIDHPCDVHGCSKRAMVEVFSTFNERLGRYCTPHGNDLVKKLNQ